jgi:hypothetical protein
VPRSSTGRDKAQLHRKGCVKLSIVAHREIVRRARTDEGRKRAQARRVRFGREAKLIAHQRVEARPWQALVGVIT